jgi:voltage-gated potassium channel Kch
MGILSLMLGFFRDIGEILRDPKSRAIFVWVLLLLMIGTLFYTLVEGWTIVDSFYFSVITLTTVGYGDFSPVTTAGKLFTTVYILVGISIIVVFANTLAKKHAHRITARMSKVSQNGENPGPSDGGSDSPTS